MNNKERERIAVVEANQKNIAKEVKGLRKDVKEILENHLPHIKKELAVSKLKVGLITGGVGIVVATVVTILVTKILGAL